MISGREVVAISVLVLMLFLIQQVILLEAGRMTGKTLTFDIFVFLVLLGGAWLSARWNSQRRHVRGFLALGAMLLVDLGTSVVVPLRSQPFLFPSAQFVGELLVLVVVVWVAGPRLQHLFEQSFSK